MRSTQNKWFIRGSLMLAATALFAGCVSEDSDEVKTDLVITAGAELVTSSTTKSFTFGETKLTTSKTQVFTVSNVSNSGANITGVATADLALTPPFAAATGAAQEGIDPCTAGMHLNPGEGCIISVSFSPTALGVLESPFQVSFTGADLKAAAEVASITLKGEGLPPPAPILLLSLGAGISTTGAIAPYNFGNVGVLTTKYKVFTLSNTGDAAATFPGLASSDLGLTPPFTATPAAAEAGLPACQTTQPLPPGGACLIAVNANPTSLGLFENTLQVSYVGPNAPQALQVKLKLLLTATLDCSISAELSASRVEGVQAAQARMATEAAQGTADGRAAGEALTYVDGQTAGYNKGYTDGYNSGYNGPNGYDAGYPVGYTQGYNRGKADVASCNQGYSAGQSAGQSDGALDGKADGYGDGYDDGFLIGAGTGYNNGYNDGRYTGAADGTTEGRDEGTAEGASVGYDDGHAAGYPVGYSDGYDYGVCTSTVAGAAPTASSGTSAGSSNDATIIAKLVAPAAGDEDWVGQCYNQGFNATYNSATYGNAYNAAYATAKAANQQYQAGYAEAYPRGRAAGLPVGTAAGYAKGRADGDAAGFAVGSAEEYDRCYDNAYPGAYNTAYSSAYNSWYITGQADGIDDSYDAAYISGHNAGYDVGYNSTYASAYNSGYSSAYSTYYATGWDAGYDAGFDSGYYDADIDTCSDFVTTARMLTQFSEPSRLEKARTLSKPAVAPAPTSIPTRKTTTSKRVFFGKRLAAKKDQTNRSPLKGYGASWTTDRFKSTDPMTAPRSVVDKWAPEQLKELLSIRDLKDPGSLRRFLRSKNQTQKVDGRPQKYRGRSISPQAKAKS